MYRERRGSRFSGRLDVALVLAIVALGAPSAASAAPPSKMACAQADPFERLACRQAAIAGQVGYTADTAFADGTKLHRSTSADRVAHIRRAKAIALRSAKVHTKESFKRHAKNEMLANKGGGHLVPLSAADDANGDGICDYEQGSPRARCAAVELGDNGQLQACNPAKKNKGKGLDGLDCDVFLDPDTTDSADILEAAEELDGAYSSTEDNLIEMNVQLDNVNASGSTVRALGAANACTIPEVDTALGVAVHVLRITHATLFGIAREMADIFGQTAFGFNGRGAAFAFDVAASLANIAFITTDKINNMATGEVQTAIMACVNQSSSDIAALRTQMATLQATLHQEHLQIQTNDNTNTAALMSQIEDVRREVVDILNTPQGLRTGFPSNSGGKP